MAAKDGDARGLLGPHAEPPLQRRVAVSGPQRPVVGGHRGELRGMDLGRGVGRAQGCVPSVRERMVQLRLLRNRGEHPHCGGPQVEVAVMTSDYELGMAGTRGCVLQDSVCFEIGVTSILVSDFRNCRVLGLRLRIPRNTQSAMAHTRLSPNHH